MQQLVIQSGSFGVGYYRRVVDDSPVAWPLPTSEAGMRYWKHLYRDDPELAMARLFVLEQKNHAWATTLAWELIAG